jgi:hypothetical protein
VRQVSIVILAHSLPPVPRATSPLHAVDTFKSVSGLRYLMNSRFDVSRADLEASEETRRAVTALAFCAVS